MEAWILRKPTCWVRDCFILFRTVQSFELKCMYSSLTDRLGAAEANLLGAPIECAPETEPVVF